MPTYDYRCEANGQIVEVRHAMSERLDTWGAVCQMAGISPGDTPAETPVERLMSGGSVVQSNALKNAEAPSCSTGACGLGGGMCGL